MVLLIKIGGAAITNKKEKHQLKLSSIEWFGKLIHSCFQKNQKIIIVHGVSFKFNNKGRFIWTF